VFDQHWILFPSMWHLPRLSQGRTHGRPKCAKMANFWTYGLNYSESVENRWVHAVRSVGDSQPPFLFFTLMLEMLRCATIRLLSVNKQQELQLNLFTQFVHLLGLLEFVGVVLRLLQVHVGTQVHQELKTYSTQRHGQTHTHTHTDTQTDRLSGLLFTPSLITASKSTYTCIRLTQHCKLQQLTTLACNGSNVHSMFLYTVSPALHLSYLHLNLTLRYLYSKINVKNYFIHM